jgi:Protein of unknown function (DUF3106)
MNRSKHLFMLICAAVLAFAGTASAQAPMQDARSAQTAAQAPEWERLTPAQRDAVMAVVRERWNANPRQRAQMLQHAERWQRMTPEQRQRAQKGERRWQQMSPEQRKQARAKFDQGRHLPPEQRAALRERLKAMTPEQRREWLQKHRRQQGRSP